MNKKAIRALAEVLVGTPASYFEETIVEFLTQHPPELTLSQLAELHRLVEDDKVCGHKIYQWITTRVLDSLNFPDTGIDVWENVPANITKVALSKRVFDNENRVADEYTVRVYNRMPRHPAVGDTSWVDADGYPITIICVNTIRVGCTEFTVVTYDAHRGAGAVAVDIATFYNSNKWRPKQ